MSIGIEVSRTVIREAVKVLAAKGLVESRPKIGTRVLPRSHWSLIDPDVLHWSLESDDDESLYQELYEVRLIIEPQVAALAAERRSDEEARWLDELITTMGASLPDVPAFVSADLDLHATILSSAHNELLAQLTGTIRVALSAGQRVTARVQGGPGRALEEHRAVVEAIKAKDPEAAADTMERLIRSAAQDLQHILHPGRPALESRGRRRAVEFESGATVGRPDQRDALIAQRPRQGDDNVLD
jgi:GntR family galactonate operon transcriptional repressor